MTSPIEIAGNAASSSSFRMVPSPTPSPMVASLGLLRSTVNVSSGSTSVSPFTAIVTVFSVSPLPKFTVPPLVV